MTEDMRGGFIYLDRQELKFVKIKSIEFLNDIAFSVKKDLIFLSFTATCNAPLANQLGVRLYYYSKHISVGH